MSETLFGVKYQAYNLKILKMLLLNVTIEFHSQNQGFQQMFEIFFWNESPLN